jgi:hypothetical protein
MRAYFGKLTLIDAVFGTIAVENRLLSIIARFFTSFYLFCVLKPA